MLDLIQEIQRCLKGRVCLVGVGNVSAGDDGFGVRLAEALLSLSDTAPDAAAELDHSGAWSFHYGLERLVLVAGMSPERFIGRLVDAGFEHVIFLDAVECGAAPGAVVFLDAKQMAARFPQVSTHKFSLGLLARCIEANGRTKAWLLGVEPESVRPAARLSAAVQETVKLLTGILAPAGIGSAPTGWTEPRARGIA
jgi:hydrogenase maturation protease